MTSRDPWQYLARNHPNVKVHIRAMSNRWGQCVWVRGKPHIELASDLGAVEQRCCLAHEIQHLIAGQPCISFCADNEAGVIEATARWLLPDLDEIGATLRDHDIVTAAAHLGVTLSILNDRLHNLAPSEDEELAAMLTASSEPAGVMAAYGQPRRGTPRRTHRCTCMKEETA
jgi:Zn-dependent peptidase ImmA (M78 family)